MGAWGRLSLEPMRFASFSYFPSREKDGALRLDLYPHAGRLPFVSHTNGTFLPAAQKSKQIRSNQTESGFFSVDVSIPVSHHGNDCRRLDGFIPAKMR